MRNPRLILALLLAVTIVTALLMLPFDELLVAITDWASQNRRWAFSVITAGITVGILFLLPSSLMTMLAGYLFGLWMGFLSVWIATFLASSAAFMISRTVARKWIERRIARRAIFKAVDRAIQRKGFLVVLLTRLAMVLPYPALNYWHGLTSVRFGPYLLATMIGMVPPILLFVFLGTTASNVAAIARGDVGLERDQMLIGIGAAVVVLGIIALIIRSATRALKEELMSDM